MNINMSGVDENYTPLIVMPSQVRGIDYQMPVASAQVKSAILLAGLFANEETVIHEIEMSRNHTETMFAHYQIPVETNQLTVTLPREGLTTLLREIFMFQVTSLRPLFLLLLP